MVVKDRSFSEVSLELGGHDSSSSVTDPSLYAMLVDLRRHKARSLSLPPYVIFQDPALEAMSTFYPVTLEELAALPGVGVGKARRYGQEFVELIRRHVEDNDITRPEDIRVRTTNSRSKLKVSLIQAVDRKIDLEEFADSKGISFDELLDELESIVESGIKLNIDYFIEEVIDDDRVDEITDTLRETESDSIDLLLEELGSDYSDQEVRLVKVKFISEMGN